MVQPLSRGGKPRFIAVLHPVPWPQQGGMAQPAVAAAMGVSLSTVNRAHMAYDHGGIKALKPRPNGGRKDENMTVAEEKALLARFAKTAGAGEMVKIHD